MSFLQQEPTTFINIKLSDTGRKLAALGKLRFKKAVLLDREINYSFDRNFEYEHCQNIVLAPNDGAPLNSLVNFDGTPPISLDGKVFSNKQIITARTESVGFFSATTVSGETLTFSSYTWSPDVYINTATTLSQSLVNYTMTLATGVGVKDGGIFAIRLSPDVGTTTGNYLDRTVLSPEVYLWYRYSGQGSTTILTDRKLPSLNSGRDQKVYFFPWNGISSYYGSGQTQDTTVWNLNIVRTSPEIGSPATPAFSSYTNFGSYEFNGTKRFFGFDKNTPAIGFVHYSNNNTGNTYAEQFIPKQTIVDIPWIMWHKYNSVVGDGQVQGVRFDDSRSEIYFDNAAKTSYTLLQEQSIFGETVVGRVYFKLKTIVITDQELLTALSFKSNRSWTLPPLKCGLSSQPLSPLNNINTTGLCKSDHAYYVTYLAKADSPFASSQTYGYAPFIHCNYVQRIEGLTDSNGLPQYLSAYFAERSFPYMRAASGMTAYSGTGWNSNQVQILVNEVHLSADTGFGGLDHSQWRMMSDSTIGGNGVYPQTPSVSPIEPKNFINHQFIVSRNDFTSGSTYNLSTFYSDFFLNKNYRDSTSNVGLTYGNEYFFAGNITTTIAAIAYKTTITVVAPNNQFNQSLNSTFNYLRDTSTYITEIAILDENNNIVGTAKPTYPIKKNSVRYLTFKLEIDF